MESSEEEDDFVSHEWITPQSHINSIYQSNTEKGIRRLCCELLDLKDAVENLCGNMHTKYLAFLRISEEVIEMEQELIELQKHISSQGILVQDLMSGVCRELEVWSLQNDKAPEAEHEIQDSDMKDLLPPDMEDPKVAFFETIDVLLAEHKVEEALSALHTEEKNSPELAQLNESGDISANEDSSYQNMFLKRKVMLVSQLVEISKQPYVSTTELKKALSGLLTLGEGLSAHQLLLNAYGFRLRKKIEDFLPSCSVYVETYPATLSQLVFTTISLTKKESDIIFGDTPVYINRFIHWAECEIEAFIRLVKENSPLTESVSALRSVSICLQASLGHCAALETQGLKFSKFLMVHLHPHFEEVLDMNFRRARRKVLDLSRTDDPMLLSPEYESELSGAASSNIMFTNTGKKFMYIVKEILEQLTPMAILYFGGTVLNKLSQLFDKYVDSLIKALPGPSEDDTSTENKVAIYFRAETDAQQLAVMGAAFTVADELLPMAVSAIFSPQSDRKEPGNGLTEVIAPDAIITIEFRDWKRHLQKSLDKLRDHFCRYYILNFVYSREGKARLDARMYLNGKAEDLFWDPDPLPSLPFQALFARLQQLASVAGDVLLGKEKIQKILLSRLTETVVMWLSDEQEFWDVFEDDSVHLQPFGLQQLILDMHFVVEIAVCGGYSSRNVHQNVSAVIARAIRTFSSKGVDPQSALPEDEWFVDTAKAAINKLLLGTSGSESSEADEHIVIHDVEISGSEDTISSPSIAESVDSFASANMGETDSPVYLTDPES
ncbi:hypothetical protein QJS04_geneDACA017537 [Acorus gramineus]|uniref:Exocyst component Exo84 C-terminal domain-containing protein n=1 Tax=Acorus gramineus TaxID=55184 RepID=A0AAV9BSC3_ACOGR|nr:hypothetical protein QJS04_geneDACA017537 [Acorus gramineus]